MSRVLGGRYEILERIGEGGMSVVYKAKCRLLHRYVAIKILKPEFLNDNKFVESFRRESQAAASLIHPNIVNIYDVGLEGINIHYIVMEYVEGKTLGTIIEEEGKLSDYDTIEIGKQIASALSFAHKNHIIHRDIKPHNILIAEDGTAKITDFGIAKAVNSTTLVAPDKSIMGSVHYFSPEQARGGYVDEKSDIYSLGVVMYEMITGKVPFDGDNPVSVAMMHINQPVVPPSQYSPRMSSNLEKVIMKCMDKYQVNRFNDADELLDILGRIDLDAGGGREILLMDGETPEDAATKFLEQSYDPSETRVMGKDYEEALYLEEQRRVAAVYEEETEIEGNLPLEEELATKKEKKVKKKKEKKKGKRWAAKIFGVLLGIVAAFFLSQFILSYFVDSNEPLEVPNLLGQNYLEAQAQLEEMGLSLEVTDRVYNSEYEIDEITFQDPAAGDRVKKGFTIKVSICRGEGINKIPKVTGLSYDEAVLAIQEAGFSLGNVSYEDSTQSKDIVLEQSPYEGEEGGVDTKVDLVLSSGEAPAVMPDLHGETLEEAKAELKELGVLETNIKILYEYHDEIEENKVIDQSVATDVRVDENTEVELTVSQGQDPSKTEAGVSGGTEKTVPLILDYNKSPNEVFGIKINLVQDGQVTMIHDSVHYKSDNGESIDITGSGTATVQVFFDDKLAYEGKLNFETGTFEQ